MHNLQTKFKEPKGYITESEALETQSSLHLVAACQVKSRFFRNWAKREITVSLEDGLLYMICTQSGRKKQYPLEEVSYTRNLEQNTVKLRVGPMRSYEIKVNLLLEQSLKDIDYYHSFKKIGEGGQELEMLPPRRINYAQNIKKPNIFPENKPMKIQPIVHKQLVSEKKVIVKPIHEYEREKAFFKSSDWKRDTKSGGLLFVNKEKKHLIPEMISYTAKKVVSSGSFSNINFPTFAMKPESTLETYCKCLGAAPLILSNTGHTPLERMKAFNAIILTMSIQFNDIQKSFNPVIGQTFQGSIAGLPVYAEHISLKPNISSFLLIGKDYKLYGNLELKADIGLNEAVGYFNGEVTLEFEDGTKIKGIMPKGIMSGVLFGDTKFGPTGAVYSYDLGNKLVSSYETKKGDHMTGHIGKLKHSGTKKLQKNLQQKNHEKVHHIAQHDFQQIHSKIDIVYTDSISYDGKLYFSYSNPHNLPIKLINDAHEGEELLPSDSTFREDIRLRKENRIKDSQRVNDGIQYQEERLRKLRKYQ